MEKRLKVAAIMLYVFAAYLILFGLVYLIWPRIMPYHERFLGKTFEELDPKMALLSVASMKVVGARTLPTNRRATMVYSFKPCRVLVRWAKG